MREAIDRVIADLEKRRKLCADHGSYNRAGAFEYAINQLKTVLAQDQLKAVMAEHETGDTRQTSTGSTDDPAKQV